MNTKKIIRVLCICLILLTPFSFLNKPNKEEKQVKLEVAKVNITWKKQKQEGCGQDPFDVANSFFNMFEAIAIEIGGVKITEKQEMEIGDEIFTEIQKQYKINDNHPIRPKILAMINKLTANAKRKGITYKVHIIDDDKFVNAFAIAGGHLHIATGLIKEVGSDDELAFIVGHEIGHVDAGHCIRQIKKALTAQQFGELGSVANQMGSVITAPFGQADEYEADKYGAYYTHNAGYNAYKGMDFFARLEKNEKYNVFGKMTRSHPYSKQRKSCLKEYIDKNLK